MSTLLRNRALVKFTFLSIVFFQLTISGFAQKKQTYNLLWEISGKSLIKPSFVFGAASFKDPRVFNFSDSVMKALQSSAIFVMENHPDSMTKLAFQQLSSIKGLKESISAENVKIIFDQFKAKYGFAPDSSLLSHPFQIIDLMKPDYGVTNNMPSSVDNYLYGIARTLKKKITGFDKPVGNINFDDAVAEAETFIQEAEAEHDILGYEEMIGIFERGNIEDILNFINANYEDGIDFSDQNKDIVKYISTMLNNEGLFFTVGVQTLAGPSGVIELLRNAGYNVRAVEATFTGVAKTYAVDYNKMDWAIYENKADQFSVSFPSTPLKPTSTGGAKTVSFADATNGMILTVSSLFTGPLSNLTSEQYIDTVFNFHAKNEGLNVLSRKKQTKYGTTVLEVNFRKNGKYARMVLVHHNQIYYTLAIESHTNTLYEPFADRFFDSFKMTAPLVISATDWISHEDKIGAFSLKIPVAAEGGIQEVQNETYPDRPYVLKMFMSSDKANQINYIFRYNDFPTGMYLSDKKAVFNSLTSNIEQNGKIIDQKRTIYKDGYEGRTLSAIVQGTYMEIQVYLRGNRVYVLLIQNMKGTEKPKNLQFFETFKFLPYNYANGEQATLGNMEITMPDVPKLSERLTKDDEDDNRYTSFLGDSETISATNKNTGGVYGVEKSTVSKYYKTKNLDSIYNLLINRLNPNASIMKPTDVTIGSLKGKEITTKDSLANTSKKMRIWFQGDNFYLQTLISSADEVDKGAFAAEFFANTKVKNEQSLFNFGSSKAGLITQDLLSKDSVTYQKALGAISYYQFGKEELPILYTAVQHTYNDDTVSTGARALLINEFEAINDDKTTGVLKALYETNHIDLIKGKILSIITNVNKNNYDWYLKSLTETPALNLKSRWDLFTPLTDSISYAASHIDQLLNMLAIEEYRPMVLDVIATMVSEKNKANYKSLVVEKKEQIVKNALQDLTEDIKKLKKNQYPIAAYSYLAILPVIDPQLTDEYTKQIFPLDSVPYLITEAFAARISANLPLDNVLLTAQLDSLTSRYTVMRAFNKVGKLAIVPAKYKKPEEFAKLLMHGYLIEEYGEPSSMKYLGTVKDGKDIYFIFDFAFEEDGEVTNHIGLVKPFKTGSQELDFEENVAYSDFEVKSKDWMKQAKEMIKELKEL